LKGVLSSVNLLGIKKHFRLASYLEMQLLQLMQELLDADQEEADDRPSFIEDMQAYHILYPKFK
jgi:hypothetical protein